MSTVLRIIVCLLIMVPFLSACNHRHHHGLPSVIPPCDDGDHASPTGESHHDKPCLDED